MNATDRDDTVQKIAEIREALEKATQGPWKWVDPGGYARKALVGEWEIMNFGASMPYSEVAGQEPDDADAHLIANAPEWLRFLIQAVEMYRELMHELDKENDHLHVKINELEKERNKLIEGLRWYADEDTHMIKRRSDGDYAPIVLDHGKRARDILKEIGVMVY